MSPSSTRSSGTPKKSLAGLSFAFPMQMPRGGTGAGQDHGTKARPKPGKRHAR